MNQIKKLIAIIILFFSFIQFINAAIDPVTVVVSVTPPFTPFLSEYASIGVNKLQVTLIVNDSRMLNYPAKLQMFIEKVNGGGVIMQTNEYAAIAPVMLTGQTTEILMGADLANYFMAQNNVFSGMDHTQYIQTGRIPDGHYRIGFRVVDAQRSDVVLSNIAFSQPGWFVLNDPPYLNLPRNKEEQRVNDPQYIKLEWFPRHLGSMNSAFAANYKVELFPIRIPGMDPNQVALSMQPSYTEITNQTRLFLTPDKYMLEPGVEYAWRVQTYTDVELTLFQNNGFSEVFSFVYGSLCPIPENIQADVLGSEHVLISWDADPLHTSFVTRFRVKDQADAIWHTCESYINSVELRTLLSTNTRYEYQVKAKTPTVESDFSPIAVFTTPAPQNKNFECGLRDSTSITNYNPKNALKTGDIIYNGNFPVQLIEVSGSNGVFTGKGRMRIPFLNNVNVNMKFENIKVNELNQVYEGKLVSVYNPNSKYYIDDVTDYWSVGDQVGNIITGQEVANIEVDFIIDNTTEISVTFNEKNVTVSSPEGSVSGSVTTTTGGTTISDSEGNLFTVDSAGNVKKVGESGGVDGTEDYGTTVSSYNIFNMENEIVFSNASNNLWAFDVWKEAYQGKAIIEREYENIGDYQVSWKLVPAGKSGKIFARVNKGNIDISKVIFKTPAGTKYFSEPKDGGVEFTVIGSEHGDGQEIFALYPMDDTTTISLGKVKVASYDMILRKLFIVPIDELNLNIDDIEKGINKIFVQYGVEWDVRLSQPFADHSWDLNNDNMLDAGETGMFTMYTDEMRALNKAYADSNTIDEEAIYVFVIQKSTGSTGVLLGDMPISSQFGYIFSSHEQPITAKTIAHELGHGMFQLKHTFDEDYYIQKTSTDNLMDYAEGTHLFKQQWDAMYDQQALLFAWAQDEEEGAYTWTPVNKQYALLFNHVYDNNHIGSMSYLKAIEDAILQGNKDTLSLVYTADETVKWTKEEKQWIDQWKIRSASSDDVFDDIIKSIKETGKNEKIPKIVLRAKHIYIGKYKYEDTEYPIAIYGNGEKTVMKNAFTKIQLADAEELKDKEKKKHIYCDETYTKYLIIAFYEDGKTDPSMIMQVEKFMGDDSKEKWLEYLSILGEPKNYEITESQLKEIFPNTDTTRLKEVMEAINNNSADYNINTVERMSHFIGQIGTETGGMKALSENECYSASSIKNVFGKVKRNGNRKYCDLFEGYDGTSLSTCPSNTLCECSPVLPDSISLDSLTVKSKYICKSGLFDYTYGCRMGNGAPSTKDGSKFKGKGFIQLTGKNKYKQISDEWNKMYPDDPKEFHGKDIDLLTTNIEIAMKASMVCWKIQGLNSKADEGMTNDAIDNVGKIVNGSGKSLPNGYEHRRTYTTAAYNALNETD